MLCRLPLMRCWRRTRFWVATSNGAPTAAISSPSTIYFIRESRWWRSTIRPPEARPCTWTRAESLIQLRLTLRRGDAQLTLYVHHSLADGHHEFSLVEELFSYYTDLVCTGRIPAVTVQPAPDPLEVVLAQRGIQKQQRSGLERFMPADVRLRPAAIPASRHLTSNPRCRFVFRWRGAS